MTLPDHYRSLASLASETGVGFFLLQEAAQHIAPTFRLNGIPYYGTVAARQLVETAQAAARPAEEGAGT